MILDDLVGHLLDKEARESIRKLLPSLHIEAPYSTLIDVMYEFDGDISPQDLLHAVKGKRALEVIAKKVEPVSLPIGVRAVNELLASAKLDKVFTILKDKKSPLDKLIDIEDISHASKFGTIDSRLKLSTTLGAEDTPPLVSYFGYELRRGEFMLLCGYPGVGKTTLTLCCAKEAVANKLKVALVVIKDWTEATLSRKIREAEMGEFIVGVYPHYALYDLYNDLELPMTEGLDVLIVDSITNVSLPKEKRYEALGEIADALKAIAQKKNMLVLGCHQLVNRKKFPTAEDLLDAKAHILAHPDWCFGVGDADGSPDRYLTTIKARSEAKGVPLILDINYRSLDVTFSELGGNVV